MYSRKAKSPATGLFAFLLYMCCIHQQPSPTREKPQRRWKTCMGLWSLRTTGMAETKARTQEIEELFAQQRSAKRLKMRKTHEGEEF